MQSLPGHARGRADLTNSQFQYTLQGETLDELQTWAPQIEARI
jgi:hypothetical protein